MNWKRTSPFKSSPIQQEIWTFEDGSRTKEFLVQVSMGKPIDILSLKIQKAADFRAKIDSVRSSRNQIYTNKQNLEDVLTCPVCGISSKETTPMLTIHSAVYSQCPKCGHVYTLTKPTDAFLSEFYKTSTEYQKTYADKSTQADRLKWISKPKAQYVLAEYKNRYGRLPKKVLDIGAGSGHFVYQLRQMGVDCEGIEISKPGIDFAKEVFGIELLDLDFTKEAEKFKCDMVTFWGLIEHVSKPVEMLEAARRALGTEGMVVAEVPRWESFSTAVHAAFPDSVVRHLDPMDHIQCFTDSSLGTAFVLGGFNIVSAWYFGMDAYELFSQVSYSTGQDAVMEKWGSKIPLLQEHLDRGRLTDFVLFVGVPERK